MTLKPLPFSLLHKANAIIGKAYSELTMPPQYTLERGLETLREGYAYKTVAVYLDDFQDPKHCLSLMLLPQGTLFAGPLVVCMLIYSTPEERTPENLDQLHLTLDSYAKIHKAGAISGSSWEYKDSRGIAPMWKARGYEKQETTYVKFL